jgi:hypothetical protein
MKLESIEEYSVEGTAHLLFQQAKDEMGELYNLKHTSARGP